MAKKIKTGVSVTPEVGLEAAQIDFEKQTVLKYGVKPLAYDSNKCEIADLDLFKETLSDLLYELGISKGSEIVLNIPTVTMRINDYPAALDEIQISGAIEEELAEHNIFKSTEHVISATRLPNSSIQFNKIAYTAAQKQMLIEVAMSIEDLGYNVTTIDTSVNSVLNALMYKQRIDVSDNNSWVLMIVDNAYCRVIPMSGKDYVDMFEERLSIGEVLGDAENYSTVISAVSPILKNLPSNYLCVVSKTNIISAEVLAGKLTYSAPIIHQEANRYSKEAFLELGPEVDAKYANVVSLDIIGAAIYRDFEPYSDAHFNLFNSSLGDIYTLKQPLEIVINGRRIVLSNEFLIKLLIVLAIPIIAIAALFYVYLSNQISSYKASLSKMEADMEKFNGFLKQHENISSELFDEGDEVAIGLSRNKSIYSYYTIVGTEIPKKLWLTHLKLSDKTTIEGQADNLESVYAFFRSIKDYDPASKIKLQRLGLASKSSVSSQSDKDFDTDSILTSLNADFYEFRISDEEINAGSSDTNKSSENDMAPGLIPME